MANSLVKYLRESREELKKVVWPSAKETRNNTLTVIGISVFISLFLGVLDIIFQFIMSKFYIR